MDAKQLAEIKAREQAATPGPWKSKKNCAGSFVVHGDREDESYFVWLCSRGEMPADFDFIAHARTDIPALIAEVEDSHNEIATLKKALGLALEDLLDAAVTPCSYCRYNPSNGGPCDMINEHHEMFSCWVWQGVDPQQAQEQEELSNG